MALKTGMRLGSYEIAAPIGGGGMGEVYRATDTKLGREVAIKVLPEAFTSDPDRLSRFEREAKVLASLNHPNIGHIYGLEEAEGTKALVLELVDGPTLADRIAQGPVPLEEALPIARQIAAALDKNPARVHSVKLVFGNATAFCPEASEERCTAVLHLGVDPIGLVRGKKCAGV